MLEKIHPHLKAAQDAMYEMQKQTDYPPTQYGKSHIEGKVWAVERIIGKDEGDEIKGEEQSGYDNILSYRIDKPV